MDKVHLNDQEIQRRESLTALRDMGIDPYPSVSIDITHHSDEIKQNFTDEASADWKSVCIAGRIMSRRIMGKAAFAELQDASGKIQIYVNRDEICPGEDKELYNTVFKIIGHRGLHSGKGLYIPHSSWRDFSSRK